MKVLANDGISQSGIDALQAKGFEVITTNVAQEQLISYINENEVTVLLVRSATTARKELVDSCPSLKSSEEVVLEWIILMLIMLVKKD